MEVPLRFKTACHRVSFGCPGPIFGRCRGAFPLRTGQSKSPGRKSVNSHPHFFLHHLFLLFAPPRRWPTRTRGHARAGTRAGTPTRGHTGTHAHAGRRAGVRARAHARARTYTHLFLLFEKIFILFQFTYLFISIHLFVISNKKRQSYFDCPFVYLVYLICLFVIFNSLFRR